MARVRIDLNRCVSAGTCIHVAPTAFGWRKGGKVEAIDPSSVPEDVLREAALACPTQAITLDEGDVGRGDATPGTGARFSAP